MGKNLKCTNTHDQFQTHLRKLIPLKTFTLHFFFLMTNRSVSSVHSITTSHNKSASTIQSDCPHKAMWCEQQQRERNRPFFFNSSWNQWLMETYKPHCHSCSGASHVTVRAPHVRLSVGWWHGTSLTRNGFGKCVTGGIIYNHLFLFINVCYVQRNGRGQSVETEMQIWDYLLG